MNNIDKLVSVIVPVYNVVNFLDRCVNSIVTQTYSYLEIILIDDGSTDGSEILCEEWGKKDNRIKTIKKRNGGLGSARNCGIYNSNGEYLAFIDSDDWWEKDAVEKLISAAEEYSADMVFMDFFWEERQENGQYMHRVFCQKNQFEGKSDASEHPELIFSGDARTWSKFYKAELFKNNGLSFPNHPFEDFPVNPLAVLLSGSICQVHMPLYHYDYKRDGNITGKTDSYSFFRIGLEELKQSLIQFGFWKRCEKFYMEYAVELARSVINGNNISQKDSESLLEYLSVHFRNEMKKYCYKVGYVGSFAGAQTIVKNAFHDRIIAADISDIPTGGEREFDCINIKKDKWEECDYIVADLLDRNLQLEEQIERISNIVNTLAPQSIVFVEELYLAKQHGKSVADLKEYPDTDAIEEKNLQLKQAYQILCNKISNAILIRFEDAYLYTYEYTTYGCKPNFYNSIFYKRAFDKINNVWEMRGERT